MERTNSQQFAAQAAASNIRAALQNLNELVTAAYQDHEVVVQYEIQTPSYISNTGPKIVATILVEI